MEENLSLNQRQQFLLTQLTNLQSLQTKLLSTSDQVKCEIFDMCYLPLFTLLSTHPQVQAKQKSTASANTGTASTSSVPSVSISLSSLPSSQTRVWELSLLCLNLLLTSCITQPYLIRASLCKRFFGIFQLLLHFIVPSSNEEKGGSSSSQVKKNELIPITANSSTTESSTQSSSTQSTTSSTSSSVSISPSEEMRLAGLTCIHTLFRCISSQFSTSRSSSLITDLQPLITIFQTHPGFSISLGYYIHLLTRSLMKEKHRGLRLLTIESLHEVMKVLKHEQLNKTITNTTNSSMNTTSSNTLTPVPGSILLMAYFPGIISSLYHILIFDSSSSLHSGGYKLRFSTFQLFHLFIQFVVKFVAGEKEIIQPLFKQGGGEKSKEQMEEDEEDGFEDDLTAAKQTKKTMDSLYALIPHSSDASSSATRNQITQLVSKSSPSISLSSIHPVLQSVLKPLDLKWWIETRENLQNMIKKVYETERQVKERKEITKIMLEAVERYLVGDDEDENEEDDEEDEPMLEEIDSSSTSFLPKQQGGTIYTTLLSSSCTLTWLEFVSYCHEHDDLELRKKAEMIIQRIGQKMRENEEKNGKNSEKNNDSMMRSLLSSSSSSSVTKPIHSPSLLPLLRSSLSRHLLQLPRLLSTSSESVQISLLKTIKGYISILGKQQELWKFIENPQELQRLMKVLYTSWKIEGKESKVLEREKEEGKDQEQDDDIKNTTTDLIPTSTTLSSSTISSGLPTYYTFSFSHLHSSTSHTLSLSILRSLGYHLAQQFGLFIAYFHEKLLQGIEEIKKGNFTEWNQLKETILFINQLILGVGLAIKQDLISVYEILPHVELIMYEYLSPTLWYLTEIYQFKGKVLRQNEQQNNLIIVSLLIRGIGDMSEAIGGEEWKSELMHLLYPLFSKLGSNHSSIHQAALVTLYRMAYACGYQHELESFPSSSSSSTSISPDSVLQKMIVENMDYLVEQMSVELRTLDMTSRYQTSSSSDGSGGMIHHPLTLPLVLTALLTKISLDCTKAIIPLLDDVLKVILDKLCELSIAHEDEEAEMDEIGQRIAFSSTSGPYGYVSTHMSRLAYLEILRSVVTAIHLIQQSQTTPAMELPSIFASAPPVPLITQSDTAKLLKTPEQLALEQADSMMNLDEYDDTSSSPDEVSEPVEKKARIQSPTASVVGADIPSTTASYFSPSSIHTRLVELIRTRESDSARTRSEMAWFDRMSQKKNENEESKSSIEDDSIKSDAEKWYDEREAHRKREAEKKFNQINGVPDEEAEEELEQQAKAHADPPEIPLTKDQQTVLAIFGQCRNFLLPGSGPRALALQISVLRIAEECIPVLEQRPKELFPEIAKFWPTLLQSLKLVENASMASSASNMSNDRNNISKQLRGGAFESSVVTSSTESQSRFEALMNVEADPTEQASEKQLTQLIQSLSTSSSSSSGVPLSPTSLPQFTHSTASPLFVQSLSVLSLLARSASKFLSGRFTNELWPGLQGVLKLEARWLAETRNRSAARRGHAEEESLRLTPTYKVQKALLETLLELSRFPDLANQHLLALSEHVAPYLSRDQPTEFQELASNAMRVLMQHDVDVVWFVLWKLCPSIDPGQSKSILPPTKPTFFAHPCFQHVFPNFDGHFLCHQRMQPTSQLQPHTPTTDHVNEYAANVYSLLTALNSEDLNRSKISSL